MSNKSVFLDAVTVHESWKEFVSDSTTIEILQKIEQSIGVNYTPSVDRVLRFLEVDLTKVLVCTYGRDPYPQAGVATGRAFEVNGATSWDDPAVNSSLKNMVKLIHKSETESEYGASIENVRSDIVAETFTIPNPDEAFEYWESNGVLFLNTAFTCEVGNFTKAGSHEKIWKPFFQMVMAYMAKKNPGIKYFLWGQAKHYAKPLRKLGVPEANLYPSNHPCTNGDTGGYMKGTKFLNNPCFYETKNLIKWVQ